MKHVIERYEWNEQVLKAVKHAVRADEQKYLKIWQSLVFQFILPKEGGGGGIDLQEQSFINSLFPFCLFELWYFTFLIKPVVGRDRESQWQLYTVVWHTVYNNACSAGYVSD